MKCPYCNRDVSQDRHNNYVCDTHGIVTPDSLNNAKQRRYKKNV